MGLALTKNESGPSCSMCSLENSASSSLDRTRWRWMAASRRDSSNGFSRTSCAPRRVASFFRPASSGEHMTMTGRSGRSRRIQRRMRMQSSSPRGKSSKSKLGGAPDWSRSIASQALTAVSTCHELGSATDQSGRRTADSRLTTSKRAVSVMFSATGQWLLELSEEVDEVKRFEKVKVERISDRFDLVPFHADCQRSLDGVDRDHQRLVSAARNQDSLKTLQGPAADTDALPDLEKWVRRPRNRAVHQGADGINLSVGNRRAFAAAADQSKNAAYAQDIQTLDSLRNELGEYIATEERQLHLLLAIAPLVHFRDNGQKRLHAALFEALDHEFLVTGASVQRIPGLVTGGDGKHSVRLPALNVGGHSFAL